MTVAERIAKEIMPLIKEINDVVDLPSGKKVVFALNFIRDCVRDRLEYLSQQEERNEFRSACKAYDESVAKRIKDNLESGSYNKVDIGLKKN